MRMNGTPIATDLNAILSEHIGKVIRIELNRRGLTHHVFKVVCRTGSYYVKMWGKCFKGIPSLKCDPHDIAIEYRALESLGALFADIFPRVVFFDQDRSLIVMTDINPNDKGQ